MNDESIFPHLDPKFRDKYIVFSMDQLEELGKGIVLRTMIEMGYKTSQFQSGRVYRQEMIGIISVTQFDKARATGRLKTFKDGQRTSKVWARREDWNRYLALHTNKKL